jgi:putative redox protein
MKVTVKQKEDFHFIGSGAEYPGDLLIDAAAHVGGKGRGFRPPELMMYSIAGCMGIHGYEALLKAGKSVDSVEVETGGERRDEYPKMFTKIVLKFRIKGSGLTEKDVKDAFDDALNRTCSIAAMVNKVAPISCEFQIS